MMTQTTAQLDLLGFDREPEPHTCACGCGGPVPAGTRGSPRRFATAGCRVRAHRADGKALQVVEAARDTSASVSSPWAAPPDVQVAAVEEPENGHLRLQETIAELYTDRDFPTYRQERAHREMLAEADRLVYLWTRIAEGIATAAELHEAGLDRMPAEAVRRDGLRTAREALRDIRHFGPGVWEAP